MPDKEFFVKASELEYTFAEKSIYNSFSIDDSSEFVPSVSYLDLHYEGDIKVPIDVFAGDLTPLQSLVKYLKENKDLSNSQISDYIGRDMRTIWLTYKSVKKKTLVLQDNPSLFVPVSVFKHESLSALEALVFYLKKIDLSYAQIARLISKDQRTIWTVFSRVKTKLKDENGNW